MSDPFIYYPPVRDEAGNIVKFDTGLTAQGDRVFSDPKTGNEVQRPLWVIDDGLIYGANAEVTAWVNMKIGDDSAVPQLVVAIGVLASGFDPKKEILLDDDGLEVIDPDIPPFSERLPEYLRVGVYFFNNYAPLWPDMAVAVAGDEAYQAARPEVMRRVLEYPFDQVGVRHLRAEISSGNSQAIAQARRLGFVERGRLPGAGDCGREDLIIFGMTREECRFLQHEEAA